MPSYKHIAITGPRQVGKSTLARWLLAQLTLPYAGFETRRYVQVGRGHLYEMVEVGTGEAVPISRLTPEGIRGIPETFDTFGARVVRSAVASDAPVVLLDEIGRFERNSPDFLRSLWEALDSDKMVIAVLKQEEIPHIQAIKDREDVFLMDLAVTSREEAREILGRLLL